MNLKPVILFILISFSFNVSNTFAQTNFEEFWQGFPTRTTKQNDDIVKSNDVNSCNGDNPFESCLSAINNNEIFALNINLIADSKQRLLQVLTSLQKNSSVLILYYSDQLIKDLNNQIGQHDPEVVKALSDLFINNESIKYLGIFMPDWEKFYSAADIKQIADSMSQNKSIKGMGLYFDQEEGTPEIYQSMVNFIANVRNLKEFFVLVDFDAQEADILGASQIIKSLVDKPIVTFSIGTNDRDIELDKGLNYFARNSKTLRSLIVNGYLFNFESGKEFADSIQNSKSIQQIELIGSYFINEQSEYSIDNLLAAIKNDQITKLKMDGMGYSEGDMVKLFEFVETSHLKSLEFIDCSHSSCPPDNIVNVIKNNSSLETLVMKDVIRFSQDTAKKLSDALRVNTNLKKVNFSHSMIRVGDPSILAASLEDNYTIIEFLADWNGLTQLEKDVLNYRLERNRRLAY